jgi:hypothetical protein
MTQWEQVAQVTGPMATVSDVKPGRWYQVRLAAVNVYGSQGWSHANAPFTSSIKPRKPGRPTNVTLGDRVFRGHKVAVVVRWQPPELTDLPVTRYKLYWSKRTASSSPVLPSASREYRQVLPGDKLSFTVADLDPDSGYFFQIQAISQFGGVKLKGERASVTISTYRSSSSAGKVSDTAADKDEDNDDDDEDADDDDDEASPRNQHHQHLSSATLTMSADKPIYENGNLKVNVTWTTGRVDHDLGTVTVHWSPEACIADTLAKDGGLTKTMSSTTRLKFFVIHDLRFDCRYIVRVERLGANPPITAYIAVTTPSCSQVFVPPTHPKPDCPADTVAMVAREPRDVQHTFIISSSNITARLTWNSPDADDVPLSGYRVVWGQLVQSEPIQMDKSALTKVLPKEAREFNIGGLLPATTYIARVQALDTFGVGGQTHSILFATPLLQTDTNDEASHDAADHRPAGGDRHQYAHHPATTRRDRLGPPVDRRPPSSSGNRRKQEAVTSPRAAAAPFVTSSSSSAAAAVAGAGPTARPPPPPWLDTPVNLHNNLAPPPSSSSSPTASRDRRFSLSGLFVAAYCCYYMTIRGYFWSD